MDTIVCRSCGGMGESEYQDESNFVRTVRCASCGGCGQVCEGGEEWPINPEWAHKRAQERADAHKRAMEAAVEAVEKLCLKQAKKLKN